MPGHAYVYRSEPKDGGHFALVYGGLTKVGKQRQVRRVSVAFDSGNRAAAAAIGWRVSGARGREFPAIQVKQAHGRLASAARLATVFDECIGSIKPAVSRGSLNGKSPQEIIWSGGVVCHWRSGYPPSLDDFDDFTQLYKAVAEVKGTLSLLICLSAASSAADSRTPLPLRVPDVHQQNEPWGCTGRVLGNRVVEKVLLSMQHGGISAALSEKVQGPVLYPQSGNGSK